MILIGMLDSPFVRRVAVTMKLHGLAFEHRSWSVGRDFERIRQYNPLGRVPALVLDDGEVLIESSAILDYLDEWVGPTRALLPVSGIDRRRALQHMAVASGAAEKAVLQLYEGAFRPAEKRHEPWVARCRSQMDAAFAELEKSVPNDASAWLLGSRFSQADVTVACVYTFASEALNIDRSGDRGLDGSGNSSGDRSAYPRLSALTARCEAMPEFASSHLPFFVPTPT